MSLTHALLGLLATAPASGYELTKAFEQDLGRYAWQAGHTSIYPELNKLAGRGLVEVTHEGARGAKTYDITPDGRTELRTWLLTPPGAGGTVRNEQVLRMFLLTALEPADQRLLLTRIAERTAEGAAELGAVISAVHDGRARDDAAHAGRARRDGPRPRFGLLAAEYGRRQYEAVHGWALWALEQISDEPADADVAIYR